MVATPPSVMATLLMMTLSNRGLLLIQPTSTRDTVFVALIMDIRKAPSRDEIPTCIVFCGRYMKGV